MWLIFIFWSCKFAHASTNKSSGLWSVHNKEMWMVGGSLGILGYWHPLNIPCSSFACGSLKMHKCLLCVLQSWLWGSEEAQRECLMNRELLGCTSGSWLWVWHDHVWLSPYFSMTGFTSAFCALFSTYSVKALLIKISFFFWQWTWHRTLRVDNCPVAESQLTQGKSKAKTDENRSFLKEMMSDGSSLCASTWHFTQCISLIWSLEGNELKARQIFQVRVTWWKRWYDNS